jgi:hypothetical protein
MRPEERRPSEQQEDVQSGLQPDSSTVESSAPQFTVPGSDGTGRDREHDETADPAGSEKSGNPEEKAMRIENE